MARALLIHNPAARSAPGPLLLRAIAQELRMAGFSVEAAPSKAPGDLVRLTRLARKDAFDRVVVCGGDGSVREAAEGLMGSDLPLGIVPLGTVNVLARELGLPYQRPRSCAVAAARGLPRRIGLGTVGPERAFTFCASAGLDSIAVEGVNLQEKSQTGPWAYAHAALNGLLDPGIPSLRVTLPDGTSREAEQVFAVRSRRYGGEFTLSARAGLDSPFLTLVLAGKPFLRRLPLLLPRLLWSGLDAAPGVDTFEVEAFLLEASGPAPVQADGDLVAHAPTTIFSRPAALFVVVPPEGEGRAP
jgi:diacylglycerol kinase (ATP)